MVDYDTFKNECLLVSKNLINFSNFKRNNKITYMLEQTNPVDTAEFFTRCMAETLVKKYKDILPTLPWSKLLVNDSIGNPLLFDTPILSPYVEKSSHTTLRYILYALDIYNSWKERSIGETSLRIVEVGCGYGGQSVILSIIFKFYGIDTVCTIIDLPEVLELTNTYLQHATYTGVIQTKKIDSIDGIELDLFVSMFSLGEIPEVYQNIYIEKLVKKSKYGYIVWNHKFMNPSLYHSHDMDVLKITPRFDRYVTVLAWPAIMELNPVFDLPRYPFVNDYLELVRKEEKHFTALLQIVKESGEPPEEGIMMQHFEKRLYFNLRQVDLYILSRMCSKILNIGFNTGHSTLIMLLANPDCVVTCIDNCEHVYTKECFAYLEKHFPGRVNLVEGESKTVIRQLTDKFDMSNINGSHDHLVMNLDFWNSRSICNDKAYVVWNNLDFYSCLPLWYGFENQKAISTFTLLSDQHLLGQFQ